MAGDWPVTPLSDLTEAETPVTYGVVKPGEEDTEGVLFIRGGDIANGRILTEQLRTISKEISRQYKRTLLRGGEILMSLVGNPGQVAIVPESLRGANIARQAALIRLRPDVNTRFVRYFLGSRVGQEALRAHSRGSVQQVINLRDLKTVGIPTPPLPEQRAIAHILGTLDDKIELNRRMNETLEEMARALFTNCASREDWNEFELGEVCVIYDGPHATPKLVDRGPVFLGISNLADGLLDLSDTAHVTDDDFKKRTRRVIPSPGDVVFSYETRLGQAAIVPRDLVCCLGRRMGLLRPKPGKTEGIVLLRAFLGPEFQETIRQRTIHGSTVDRIPLMEMGKFPIRLPNGEAMMRLANQLTPLRAQVDRNDSESRTLAALRDTLLPKLISGELRVKEAKRAVEAVA